MVPLKLQGKNVLQLRDGVSGEEYTVYHVRGITFSPWLPTTEELNLLNEGKPIWLAQVGTNIPSMRILVGETETVVPADMYFQHQLARAPEMGSGSPGLFMRLVNAVKERI